jgi:DNA-binding HxlR family transcriptional regulator
MGASATRSIARRPLVALLDLLGRRQCLRVIWELREVKLTFRALQQACGGVSPTVLNRRLKELRESGLVDVWEGDGYGLTPLGHQLRRALQPLREWAEERWVKRLR